MEPDLAVMGVLSPGLIFSGWNSVRAKLIDTTESRGCEFGVHERARVKGTVGDTGVWTSNLIWNNSLSWIFWFWSCHCWAFLVLIQDLKLIAEISEHRGISENRFSETRNTSSQQSHPVRILFPVHVDGELVSKQPIKSLQKSRAIISLSYTDNHTS